MCVRSRCIRDRGRLSAEYVQYLVLQSSCVVCATIGYTVIHDGEDEQVAVGALRIAGEGTCTRECACLGKYSPTGDIAVHATFQCAVDACLRVPSQVRPHFFMTRPELGLLTLWRASRRLTPTSSNRYFMTAAKASLVMP